MEYGPDPVTSSHVAAAAVAPRRKRRHPRHQVSSLAYVNVNQGNGGIIRDLAETGIAIQAVAPLQADQQVQLRFELVSPRLRVETMGRVAWADSGGQAGIEFTALPRRSHRLLKDWLFTHLLSSAQNAAWDTIFTHGRPDPQLQFSAVARPPIRLAARVSTGLVSNDVRRATLRILGVRVGIQPHVLSRLLDGLILLAAVLLFCIVGIAITHIIPSWPTALVMVAVLTSVIACLYGFLFNFWIGATPGASLAQLACRSDEMQLKEEDRPRFR
ncbi:MAG TPA: PilZ domain-containing protein [Terriglobales bacterium]|nr:PilZ domain-containing protein [Terriglobales bacterium]